MVEARGAWWTSISAERIKTNFRSMVPRQTVDKSPLTPQDQVLSVIVRARWNSRNQYRKNRNRTGLVKTTPLGTNKVPTRELLQPSCGSFVVFTCFHPS